ncbi:MAG TPA: hypothetical protein VF011_11315 [Terriglobales bacterium]
MKKVASELQEAMREEIEEIDYHIGALEADIDLLRSRRKAVVNLARAGGYNMPPRVRQVHIESRPAWQGFGLIQGAKALMLAIIFTLSAAAPDVAEACSVVF